MTSEQIQHRILERLLATGPLNMFALAHDIDQAPFRVRGDLSALRRRRLVYDYFDDEQHLWMLTAFGYKVVAENRQLTLTTGAS